ncbi:hypothetical protein QQX98_002301 [Neonectria punicea]|uniref:Uncharacterized protein n=1 Tax=Neonectria punicea TaxID=979145 RepID=A0ABR1HK41_9HYPO
MSVVYERMFATDKEAYEAVQQAQRDQGFTTSKRRSTGSARHGRNVRIDVRCHRSGKYRPWDKKQEKYKTHTQTAFRPRLHNPGSQHLESLATGTAGTMRRYPSPLMDRRGQGHQTHTITRVVARGMMMEYGPN